MNKKEMFFYACKDRYLSVCNAWGSCQHDVFEYMLSRFWGYYNTKMPANEIESYAMDFVDNLLINNSVYYNNNRAYTFELYKPTKEDYNIIDVNRNLVVQTFCVNGKEVDFRILKKWVNK